jgi:hypothetical protein
MSSSASNRAFKTTRFSKDAKKAKIKDDELRAFRLLANSYAGLTAFQVSQLIVNGDFVEICHDEKTEIQK